MTFEEAAVLDPDTHAGELVAGRWVPVTRNTLRHGEILVNIAALLKAYTRVNRAFRVSGGDPGTKLGRQPDVLRGPDVAVVSADRWPEGAGAAGWLEGAPDLAVEVAGDAQPASELARKALEYLAAGGRMVWVVDPSPRRVIVYFPPDHVRVLGPDDEIDGVDVLPGFRCRVAEFFE